MSTTLIPPAPMPPPSPAPQTGPHRFPTVFANLLPDEVIAGRRARQLQQRVLAGLGLLLVVLVGWYGLSMLQTSSANSSLAAATRTTDDLQSQQRGFAPLINAQQQSTAIQAQLRQLMAGDVQWSDLLAALRKQAPAGTEVTSINGTLAVGSSAAGGSAGGLGVLNATGKTQIGSLALSGTAKDKNAVAAYIDALGKVPGLAAPFPASVADGVGGLTWSANVILTTDVLGGRYNPSTQGGR
jgi:Tfp pilus assembly protein PilN